MNKNSLLAHALLGVATIMLTVTANSRCFFVYHQPKHPSETKKFRKF